MVFEHLGISKFFSHVFLSSELGADKPDPEIFRRALRLSGAQPNDTLHVGDDPDRDWKGATEAGLSIFQLERPRNSLRDLLPLVAREGVADARRYWASSSPTVLFQPCCRAATIDTVTLCGFPRPVPP